MFVKKERDLGAQPPGVPSKKLALNVVYELLAKDRYCQLIGGMRVVPNPVTKLGGERTLIEFTQAELEWAVYALIKGGYAEELPSEAGKPRRIRLLHAPAEERVEVLSPSPKLLPAVPRPITRPVKPRMRGICPTATLPTSGTRLRKAFLRSWEAPLMQRIRELNAEKAAATPVDTWDLSQAPLMKLEYMDHSWLDGPIAHRQALLRFLGAKILVGAPGGYRLGVHPSTIIDHPIETRPIAYIPRLMLERICTIVESFFPPANASHYHAFIDWATVTFGINGASFYVRVVGYRPQNKLTNGMGVVCPVGETGQYAIIYLTLGPYDFVDCAGRSSGLAKEMTPPDVFPRQQLSVCTA